MRLNLYRIDGIHDERCARRIEARLGSEPGVQRVAVSSAAREARVLLDPDRTTDQNIVAAIAQAGYHVIPPDR